MAATKRKDPAGKIRVDKSTGKIYELRWTCVGQTARGCGGGAHVAGPVRRVKKATAKKRATAPKKATKKRATKRKTAKR